MTRGGVNHAAATIVSSSSKEYQDAVKVLSADRMRQACQLVLQLGNSGDGNDDTTPAATSKLQDMYFQAEEAAKIVAQQQPIVMRGSGKHQLQPQPPPGTAAPSLSHLSKGAASSASVLRGTSLKPKFGGDFTLPTGVGIKHGLKGNTKGVLMRGRMMGATGMRGMASSSKKRAQSLPPSMQHPQHAHKKQRLSPTAAMEQHQSQKAKPSTKKDDDGNTTPTTSTAPPPSALSFLAKLNNKTQPTTTSNIDPQEQEPENEHDEEEEEEESSSYEEESTTPTPDPNPNARRNPRRGAHPNRK